MMAGQDGRGLGSRQTVAVVFILCSLAPGFTCFTLRGLNTKTKQGEAVREATGLGVRTGSVFLNGRRFNSQSGSASAAPDQHEDVLHGDSAVRAVREGVILFGRVFEKGSDLNSQVFGKTGTSSNASAEDEAAYQADSSGWTKGDQSHSGGSSSEPSWRRMSPSLQCGGEQLKFRAVGPGASHFEVGGEHGSPVPLSQVPPTCGYTMQKNPLALLMLVPYDGCNVVQEVGSYVLPMRWQGVPVSLWCPKNGAAPTTAAPTTAAPTTAAPTTAAPQETTQPPFNPPSHQVGQNPDMLHFYNQMSHFYNPYQFFQSPSFPQMQEPPKATTTKPTTTAKPTTAARKQPPVQQYFQYPGFYPGGNSNSYPPVTTQAPEPTTTAAPSAKPPCPFHPGHPSYPMLPFPYPLHSQFHPFPQQHVSPHFGKLPVQRQDMTPANINLPPVTTEAPEPTTTEAPPVHPAHPGPPAYPSHLMPPPFYYPLHAHSFPQQHVSPHFGKLPIQRQDMTPANVNLPPVTTQAPEPTTTEAPPVHPAHPGPPAYPSQHMPPPFYYPLHAHPFRHPHVLPYFGKLPIQTPAMTPAPTTTRAADPLPANPPMALSSHYGHGHGYGGYHRHR